MFRCDIYLLQTLGVNVFKTEEYQQSGSQGFLACVNDVGSISGIPTHSRLDLDQSSLEVFATS